MNFRGHSYLSSYRGSHQPSKDPKVTRAHTKIPASRLSTENCLCVQPAQDDKGGRTYHIFYAKTMDRSFHLPGGLSTTIQGSLGLLGPLHAIEDKKTTRPSVDSANTTASEEGVRAKTVHQPKSLWNLFSKAVTKMLRAKDPRT